MHEDPDLELRLAAETAVRRSLVVASGGDLALALVAHDVQVQAVDANPAQIALVQAKVAVAQQVGPEQAAAWMVGNATAAADLLARAAPDLALRAADLRHGLCFCGSVDRRLRVLGPWLRFLYDWPRLSPGLFRRAMLAGMRRCLQTFAATLHGRAAAARIDDRAIALLQARVHRALRQADAPRNPWLQALLGFGFGPAPPSVWTANGIRAWCARAAALSLRATTLADALAACPRGSLQLVSVSNVADLLDEVARRELLALASAALAPGGHLVMRSMLRHRAEQNAVPSQATGAHLRGHGDRVPANDLTFQELAVQPDASPLCPVVWLGQKR